MNALASAPVASVADVNLDIESTYKKVFWRIVPFLMLCYVAAYLDRVNVSQTYASTFAIFEDGRIWHMSLIYFCLVMGQYALTLWMPTLVNR